MVSGGKTNERENVLINFENIAVVMSRYDLALWAAVILILELFLINIILF